MKVSFSCHLQGMSEIRSFITTQPDKTETHLKTKRFGMTNSIIADIEACQQMAAKLKLRVNEQQQRIKTLKEELH